jgi:ADP-ribosylglycohydrolase
MRSYVERTFGYDLDQVLDHIRPVCGFDVTCQVTVPNAMICFLESNSFEDAVRNAVSLGGDTDTLACIAGSVAHPFYGVPDWIEKQALSRLDAGLRRVIDEFMRRFRRLP